MILDAVYVICFGGAVFGSLTFHAKDSVAVGNAAAAGWSVLSFAVVIPAVIAVVAHVPPGQLFGHFPRTVKSILLLQRVSPIPQAWDFLGRTRRDMFVRVLKGGDHWVGGWYGTGSAMSSFPADSRDIYVSLQFELAADGTFVKQLPDTAGVWLVIEDGDVVEWLDEPGSKV